MWLLMPFTAVYLPFTIPAYLRLRHLWAGFAVMFPPLAECFTSWYLNNAR